MKKSIFVIVALLSFASTMFAQGKRYVTIYCPLNSYTNLIKLSGDIPAGMQSEYSYIDFNKQRAVNNYYIIGDVLNLLASHGFYVEKMNTWFNNQNDCATYVCSSTTSGGAAKIETVKADDDAEVSEVARYNLQGIPVTEADKGVQIIVFSNYTTKTVVVE